MADEVLPVAARNFTQERAKITAMLSQSLVGLRPMSVTPDDQTDKLNIVPTVPITMPGAVVTLHKRLNRTLDVINTVALAGELAPQRKRNRGTARAPECERLLGIVRVFDADIVQVSPTSATHILQATPAKTRSLAALLTGFQIVASVQIAWTRNTRRSPAALRPAVAA